MVRYIAFDIDGTLYSTEPIIHLAYKMAIEDSKREYGIDINEAPSTKEILMQIGRPVKEILANLFPHLDEQKRNIIGRLVLERLVFLVSKGRGIVFEHARDVIIRLAKDGYKLLVASNGRERYIRAVLEFIGIDSYFANPLLFVNGNNIKNKSDILREYIRIHGIEKGELVMVGDRSSDLNAALDNNCHFIACIYGHNADEVSKSRYKINSLKELYNTIKYIESSL